MINAHTLREASVSEEQGCAQKQQFYCHFSPSMGVDVNQREFRTLCQSNVDDIHQSCPHYSSTSFSPNTFLPLPCNSSSRPSTEWEKRCSDVIIKNEAEDFDDCRYSIEHLIDENFIRQNFKLEPLSDVIDPSANSEMSTSEDLMNVNVDEEDKDESVSKNDNSTSSSYSLTFPAANEPKQHMHSWKRNHKHFKSKFSIRERSQHRRHNILSSCSGLIKSSRSGKIKSPSRHRIQSVFSGQIQSIRGRQVRFYNEKVKQYNCTSCDYSSDVAYRVVLHHKIVHFKLKPNGCSPCDYCSAEKANIRRHINAVHHQIKRNYPCIECDDVFDCETERDVHYRSVHSCEKSLRGDEENLLQHHETVLTLSQESTQGVKQVGTLLSKQEGIFEGKQGCMSEHFLCAHCGYVCSREEDLVQHHDSVHRVSQQEAVGEEQMQQSVQGIQDGIPEQGQERMLDHWVCAHCGCLCSDDEYLVQHLETAHKVLQQETLGEMQMLQSMQGDILEERWQRVQKHVLCVHCGYLCSDEDNLTQHLETVHNVSQEVIQGMMRGEMLQRMQGSAPESMQEGAQRGTQLGEHRGTQEGAHRGIQEGAYTGTLGVKQEGIREGAYKGIQSWTLLGALQTDSLLRTMPGSLIGMQDLHEVQNQRFPSKDVNRDFTMEHCKPAQYEYTESKKCLNLQDSLTQQQIINQYSVDSDKIVKDFCCLECGCKFTHINDLKVHSSMHVERKSNQCTDCLKTFEQTERLSMHEDVKSLRCVDCYKSYVCRASLKSIVTASQSKENFLHLFSEFLTNLNKITCKKS